MTDEDIMDRLNEKRPVEEMKSFHEALSFSEFYSRKKVKYAKTQASFYGRMAGFAGLAAFILIVWGSEASSALVTVGLLAVLICAIFLVLAIRYAGMRKRFEMILDSEDHKSEAAVISLANRLAEHYNRRETVKS